MSFILGQAEARRDPIAAFMFNHLPHNALNDPARPGWRFRTKYDAIEGISQ